MVLLYLRLPSRLSTVPASKNVRDAEGKPQPKWWMRWFSQRHPPQKSQPESEFRKTHSTYYLERRFLL